MKLEWQRLEGQNGHEGGRQLLAALYRAETGKPLPEIAVTAQGKPYFPNSPWHFSISHTKNHVFCALSRHNIGMDAEEAQRQLDPRLAARILSPEELKKFDNSREMLLKFWVLKEAQAKCTGEGLRGYPNHTNFSLDDPRVQQISGCLVAVIEGE